jgi:hypothetical protein
MQNTVSVPAEVVTVDLTLPILFSGVALLGLVGVALVVVLVVSRRKVRMSDSQ